VGVQPCFSLDLQVNRGWLIKTSRVSGPSDDDDQYRFSFPFEAGFLLLEVVAKETSVAVQENDTYAGSYSRVDVRYAWAAGFRECFGSLLYPIRSEYPSTNSKSHSGSAAVPVRTGSIL
jgi:hypothetical protein